MLPTMVQFDLLFLLLCEVHGYSVERSSRQSFDLAFHDHHFPTRRDWLRKSLEIPSTVFLTVTTAHPRISHAKTTTTGTTANPLDKLVEARDTLDTLLTNYKRATIDCTFADVPRELLESKNKELLLEKASTYALFDKSVSVETCKTTNRIVRDYLGVTGKGPLVGIDKQIKAGLADIDPDDLEEYVTELEKFSQSCSKASSLSYAAGIADFDSVNNFSKEEAEEARNSNSNLSQTKEAIQEAKTSLDRLVLLLQKGAT